MTAWLKSEGLGHRLFIAYLLMFLLPVGFLLYLVLRLVGSGGDLDSGYLVMTLVIGVPAAVAMSVAAFLLMYRSVKPISEVTKDAGNFIHQLRGEDYKMPDGDEAQKLSSYLTDMIGELKHKLNDVDRYAQQLRQANKKLVELAVNDGLTGLYNRKQADHVLAVELERAEKFGFPLCILMLDIDRFKRFNDSFGHVAGDEALRRLSDAIRQNVRRLDVCARYGGEEFLVILPETAIPAATTIAERIREAVEKGSYETGRSPDPGQLTVSLGVAEYKTGEEPVSLIKRADSALYKAKDTGRNRVCS